MKKYNYVLIDLDGTMTDSAPGIINGVCYALEKHNIKIKDKNELYKFIGPPLMESFQRFYGFSEDEARQVAASYREYYGSKGMYENIVYDGMEDLLKKIKASGRTLITATSKVELYANQIMNHFDIAKYFDYIAGGNIDYTRTNKDEVIAYALDSCGVTDKSAAIMVGDREHDILGAKKTGIDSIGVLYGYGGRQELETAGATYIAETVDDVWEIINQ